MDKIKLAVLVLMFTLTTSYAQVVKSKTIDHGGSSNYKSEAVAEKFGVPPQALAPQQFIKPELEFICELKVTIEQPVDLGATVHGKRIIIPISGGTFEGPRIKGTVLKGGADYQYVGMNGTRTELNAIYTIKTDDGVLIQVQNAGLIYAPKEKNASGPPEFYFRAAPKFEAPIDSKYAWLNNAIFICKPEVKDGYISIQVWKVL
ncbi:DUF3237 domain-containing protein [Arcticibacter sp. MXS-1]|uniref:DUF3237 domain-containing protein n=1 Tax=Arcticibacter sp. MXS-1 TaxID=3341726 RepID=UPI0035A99E88